MGAIDPDAENHRSEEQRRADAGAAKDKGPEPAARVFQPESLHLQISLDDVPEPISSLFEKLAKPHAESRLRGFVKDYSPVLTPILTALITGLVAFYGYKFDDHVSRDTLDKITTEFVQGNGDPNITAMKLAAYGDKALPAVKIALGAQDPKLRDGAVKIAAQMYFGETVERGDLTKAMLKYYDNPVLRLGVLEWFATVESSQIPLSVTNSEAAVRKLKQTFGPNGEKCEEQGTYLAQAAANFLSVGVLAHRKEFARGLDGHCPKSFDGAHKTLKEILEAK